MMSDDTYFGVVTRRLEIGTLPCSLLLHVARDIQYHCYLVATLFPVQFQLTLKCNWNAKCKCNWIWKSCSTVMLQSVPQTLQVFHKHLWMTNELTAG